jgi:hypothetical protein
MAGRELEWFIIRTLGVALDRYDLEVLVHDRGQLCVAVLANAGAIVIAMLDRLRRLAFEAVGDLLKRPALPIDQRRIREPLG